MNNSLIAVGIQPTRPETNYGYLHCGEPVVEPGAIAARKVLRFVEKPNTQRAREYFQAGDYLWNSGIYIWQLSVIRKAVSDFLLELYRSLEKIRHFWGTSDYEKILAEEFGLLENVSIDYGVMEKAKNILLLQADFGWDDVGSWLSLGQMREADWAGNVLEGLVVTQDSSGCLVLGREKLIALAGVKDMVVVDTETPF